MGMFQSIADWVQLVHFTLSSEELWQPEKAKFMFFSTDVLALFCPSKTNQLNHLMRAKKYIYAKQHPNLMSELQRELFQEY